MQLKPEATVSVCVEYEPIDALQMHSHTHAATIYRLALGKTVDEIDHSL